MLYLSILLVIVNVFVTFKNKPYDIIDSKWWINNEKHEY
jgi:hypothetical protein